MIFLKKHISHNKNLRKNKPEPGRPIIKVDLFLLMESTVESIDDDELRAILETFVGAVNDNIYNILKDKKEILINKQQPTWKEIRNGLNKFIDGYSKPYNEEMRKINFEYVKKEILNFWKNKFFYEIFRNFNNNTWKLIQDTNAYKAFVKELDNGEKRILNPIIEKLGDVGVKAEIKDKIKKKKTQLDDEALKKFIIAYENEALFKEENEEKEDEEVEEEKEEEAGEEEEEAGDDDVFFNYTPVDLNNFTKKLMEQFDNGGNVFLNNSSGDEDDESSVYQSARELDTSDNNSSFSTKRSQPSGIMRNKRSKGSGGGGGGGQRGQNTNSNGHQWDWFLVKVGYCLSLINDNKPIPSDIDKRNQWYYKELLLESNSTSREEKKLHEEYQKAGKREFNEWKQMCRSFMVVFASNTFGSVRYLDLENSVDEDDTSGGLANELSNGIMLYYGMGNVGSEPWRFQVFEKQYKISIELDYQLLKQVCKNTGVYRPNKFTSLKSILYNQEEKCLFAALAGKNYTGNKRSRDLRVQDGVQLREMESIGLRIQAHYLNL